MSVRRGALALLATVTLAALAVACTGDEPPSAPTSTPTATVEATRTAAPPATATPAPTPAPPLVVAFIGDLMFDREVELAMETEGPAYTFERVRPLFAGTDLVVGNLEGTLSSGGTPLDKVYQFQTAPDLGVAALVEGGVDVVSLSNNHATDYGIAGLEETLVALGDLEYYGAGLTEDLARAARHVQPDGQPRTLSFLGYSDIGETIFALGAQGGVSRADVETIAEDVSREREQFPGNVIVVSLHFGTEYRHEPTDRQRELARAAIDAGADLVVGHHPHALQPVEAYRDGLILYSLGNFVFDLDAEDLEVLGPGPFQSVVAVVTFEEGERPALELRPAWIDVWENRPRPATEEEAAAILDLLAPRSQTPAAPD